MSGTPDSEWFRQRALHHRSSHPPSCLGTVGLIDAAARLRGSAAVIDGRVLSLCREIDVTGTLQVAVTDDDSPPRTIGTDRVTLEAHGISDTHLDALSHFAIDGSWHDGSPCHELVAGNDRSLLAWASHGLVTRGLIVDIPSARGVPWVETDEPVTGDEIDSCLKVKGTEATSGDALIVYMGRDRFETAGHRVRPIANSADGRPGIGRSGAEWIADTGISVVCWDFLDAHGSTEPPLAVHSLIWAIGLALVDNCHLAEAAAAVAERDSPAGLLTIAPLALPGATGCLVNPLMML